MPLPLAVPGAGRDMEEGWSRGCATSLLPWVVAGESSGWRRLRYIAATPSAVIAPTAVRTSSELVPCAFAIHSDCSLSLNDNHSRDVNTEQSSAATTVSGVRSLQAAKR